MKRHNLLLLLTIPSLIALSCSPKELARNVAELGDGDPATAYTVAVTGECAVIFDNIEAPVRSYRVYASDRTPDCDPAGWVLSGSNDGRKWVELDRREKEQFCSRFQEITGQVADTSHFAAYKLEFFPQPNADTLAVGEVRFCARNDEVAWEGFVYPQVKFEVLDPATEGAAIYARLVQNPDAYIRYHARKVAEVLFYSAADTMNAVGEIDYTLKDYEGVSAKSGTPAQTAIVYSTQHIEKSAAESLSKLDFETRGVLFHELVHAYQFEPKGVGSYSTNKEFWACIEGLADAVRAQAGLFDIQALRKPGGHWLDGYKTTGFFLQWLTTKDPDALRKFHITVRDMEVWSFDKAMQEVFGQGIESMWAEYQQAIQQANAV